MRACCCVFVYCGGTCGSSSSNAVLGLGHRLRSLTNRPTYILRRCFCAHGALTFVTCARTAEEGDKRVQCRVFSFARWNVAIPGRVVATKTFFHGMFLVASRCRKYSMCGAQNDPFRLYVYTPHVRHHPPYLRCIERTTVLLVSRAGLSLRTLYYVHECAVSALLPLSLASTYTT